MARFAKGEPDKAIADLNEAIHLDPQNAVAFFNRARCRMGSQPDLALADLAEVLRLNPSNFPALANRALIWESKREWQKAIKDLDEAIRLMPDSMNLSQLGTVGEAKFILLENEHIGAADVYRTRGRCRFALNDPNGAIDDFTVALRFEPKDGESFEFRAHCWVVVGDFKRALADADEAINLDPKEPAHYITRADAWAAKNEWDRGARWISTARSN